MRASVTSGARQPLSAADCLERSIPTRCRRRQLASLRSKLAPDLSPLAFQLAMQTNGFP